MIKHGDAVHSRLPCLLQEERRFLRKVDIARVVGDAASHYLEPNAITRLFVDIIKTFHETWYCIEPITCFAVMPDHIHLLIKIRDIEKRVSLAVVVRMLMRALEKGYFAATAGGAAARTTLIEEGRSCACGGSVRQHNAQHLFEFEWHDWIVSRDGQLTAFTRYIRENAERRWLRLSRSEYFRRVNEIEFLGRKWYGYGNAELLKLPVIEPFRCSRKWAEDGEEWREAVGRAARIGPGGAPVRSPAAMCWGSRADAGLSCRPKALANVGIQDEHTRDSAPRGACSSSRFGRRWPASRRNLNCTNVATKWET